MRPEHAGLMAAVSVLALDLVDVALAERCAERAGGHLEALSTLGALALGNSWTAEALEIHEHA